MNRSILVVICDFIITSMIYLNGGFSGVESQGTDGRPADRSTVTFMMAELESKSSELEKARAELIRERSGAEQDAARLQELERLSSELAATRTRLEQLKRQAELTEKNAGTLTAEDIQKELDQEIMQRNLAQARLETMQAESQAHRDQQQQNAAALKTAAEKLEQRDQEIRQRDQELRKRDQELHKRDQALAQARHEQAVLQERSQSQQKLMEQKISHKDEQLAQTNRQLQQKEAELRKQAEILRQKEEFQRKQSEALARQREENLRTQSQLEAAQKDIKRQQQQLEAAKKEQARQQQRQSESDRKLEAVTRQSREREDKLRIDKQQADSRNEQLKREKAVLEANLRHAQAKTLELERDKAALGDDLKKTSDRLKVSEQNVAAGKKQVESLKSVVGKAADKNQNQELELAKQEAEVKKLRDELTRVKAESAKYQERAQKVDFYEQDVALVRYPEAKISYSIRMNIPMLIVGSQRDAFSCVLPAVRIGEKMFMVSTLRNIAGATNKQARRDKLNDVVCTVNGKNNFMAICVDAVDKRVAVMQLPPETLNGQKPLTLVTAPELRKRGPLQLYLFKSSTGKGVKLENRCNWTSGSGNYLVVSNAGGADTVKAAPGDVLVTQQGEFAAVVVSVKGQDASCYLFEKLPQFTRQQAIIMTKNNNDNQLFSKTLKQWLDAGDALDKNNTGF